jgi:hypothetical protein
LLPSPGAGPYMRIFKNDVPYRYSIILNDLDIHLSQMPGNFYKLKIDGIRPAGLSIDLKEELEDYRGLRHVKGVEEIGFLIININ